jgi:hypothetical protein
MIKGVDVDSETESDDGEMGLAVSVFIARNR